MTRLELAKRLQARCPELTIAAVTKGVNTIFNNMRLALGRGESIIIRGFGAFDVRYCNSRISRNPKTGERIQVPAKYKVHFKPGNILRE